MREVLSEIFGPRLADRRFPVDFLFRTWLRARLGIHRTPVRVLGYVAARHQHGDDVVTFLVVFLIQTTQNRDAQAIQLKLDELIRSVGAARNELVDLEELSDDELARLQKEFHEFHERHALHATAVSEEIGRRKRARPDGTKTG